MRRLPIVGRATVVLDARVAAVPAEEHVVEVRPLCDQYLFDLGGRKEVLPRGEGGSPVFGVGDDHLRRRLIAIGRSGRKADESQGSDESLFARHFHNKGPPWPVQ